ncbi:MAG: phosphoglycolate phosphatase [Pseudomonadota bacterium]|nr:phosphoglycolate phosphatase [Pseudomonadota bacterium]
MDGIVQPDRRQPRAVLVDLDGTMVDTAPDLAEAVNAMLAELGCAPMTAAAVGAFIGHGAPRLVARVLAAAGLAASVGQADAEALFYRHYARTNGRYGAPYAGVRAGLAALGAAGYRLACVTNKPIAFAEALLESTGLRRHFAAVVGGDSIAAMKPSPQPLLHACALLGVDPLHALMVGDSAVDAAAAHAAGMPVWLVSYGYPGQADAGALRDARQIDSLEQLAPLLAAGALAHAP